MLFVLTLLFVLTFLVGLFFGGVIGIWRGSAFERSLLKRTLLGQTTYYGYDDTLFVCKYDTQKQSVQVVPMQIEFSNLTPGNS